MPTIRKWGRSFIKKRSGNSIRNFASPKGFPKVLLIFADLIFFVMYVDFKLFKKFLIVYWLTSIRMLNCKFITL